MSEYSGKITKHQFLNWCKNFPKVWKDEEEIRRKRVNQVMAPLFNSPEFKGAIKDYCDVHTNT